MMKYASSPRRICLRSYEYRSDIAVNPRALPVLSIMSPQSKFQEY